MNKTGLIGKYVTANEYCWLHYNTEKGQSQSGDYAYLNAYAKDRVEKIEEIVWKYNSICFNCIVVSKYNEELYDIQITEPNRLTLM